MGILCYCTCFNNLSTVSFKMVAFLPVACALLLNMGVYRFFNWRRATSMQDIVVVTVILSILMLIALFAYHSIINNAHDAVALKAIESLGAVTYGDTKGQDFYENAEDFDKAAPAAFSAVFASSGYTGSADSQVRVISGVSSRFGEFSIRIGNDTQDSRTVASVALRSQSGNCAVGLVNYSGNLLFEEILPEDFECSAMAVFNRVPRRPRYTDCVF